MNAHAQSTAVSFVSIEGRSLAQALKLMTAVIEKRTTHPILSYVKIAVTGADLVLTGTDLDIEATSRLDVIDAHGDWSVCVDVGVLARIARLAGPAPLRLKPVTRENNSDAKKGKTFTRRFLAIDFDDAVYEIVALDADAFPTLPGDRGLELERFGNGSLAAILRKVSWCISNEETRYYLNGVCWQFGPDGRCMAATDGHRMSVCTYIQDTEAAKVDRIIPSKTVRLLETFTAGQDVSVHPVGDAKLDFIIGQTTIRTKLIEGPFPDFRRVMPKADSIKFRIDVPVTAGLAAVDRAMAVSNKFGGRAVRFYRGANNRVALESRNPDAGSGIATLADVAWPEEAATEFGLNGAYFRDILVHCAGIATFHGIDAGAPFRVTDEDETVVRVQMPMRV